MIADASQGGSEEPKIKIRNGQFPQVKIEEPESILNKMKKEGVIESSNCLWASPVVIVKRTIFCIDYRILFWT